MDINRLTEKAQEALRTAQGEAIRYGHQQVDVEHLLLALLDQEGGLATSILDKAGVNAALTASPISFMSGIISLPDYVMRTIPIRSWDSIHGIKGTAFHTGS